MNWLKQQPWFIYLFPTLAYLVGVKDYAAYTNITQLILYILAFTALTLLVYFAIRKLSKKSIRYTLLLFYSLLTYTFFGNLKLGLYKIIPSLSHYSTFLLLLLSLLIGLYFIFKKQRIAKVAFHYCNLLVIGLLIFQIGQFIIAKASIKKPIVASKAIQKFTTKPNVYFVLFDGYPGFESLDILFRYNNAQHKLNLEKRGFHVLDSIRSNYNYTLAAMSSLFNINYIIKEHSMPISDFSFMYKAQKAIGTSSVSQTFRREGYKVNNLSIFPFANEKGVGDYVGYLSPLQIANKYFFHNHLLSDLARKKKFKNLPIVSNYEKRLDKYYYQNKKIVEDFKNCIDDAQPTFSYAHLLLPHEPYLTDSAGNLWEDLSTIPEKEAFVEYTKYASKLMLELADAVQKKDSNSILIFLSDHGYRGLTGEDKKYSYHNFMAIKTAENNYRNIEKIKSNINIFPYLLNEHCGQQLPYKRDSTFYIFYTKNVFETLD